MYTLKQLLFTFFFTQVKILVCVINIWVVNRVNVCLAKDELLFFTSALPTLFAILRVSSVDSMSRLNVILTVPGTITWFLEPCDIVHCVDLDMVYLACWSWLYVLCFLWRQIVFYVLPCDPVLYKHSLSLFNMYFYHDILWPFLENFFKKFT